jgi:Di-haem oxidoreductase, putative peroxidase
MRRCVPVVGILLATLLVAGAAWAQAGVPSRPGLAVAHADNHGGTLDPATGKLFDVRRMGMLVFTTPFTKADGYGDGPFDPSETNPVMLGHRPTLQGNGTLLRVNGLDAQSCNECHSIVKHSTQPPTLGIAGVGGMVQDAIIMPSVIDVADSFDDRINYVPSHDPDLPLVADGVADFNGRLANPPFLFGGGGVELLGKEMTEDLQALLAQARAASSGTVTSLDTHGVNFGYLVSLGGGNVDVSHVQGIGPENINSVSPEEALVVRPFGRKGENFSMRDFDRGAMQFHFGIQPVEVVGAGVDADGDGVSDEVTVDNMSFLHVFDVTNPVPHIDHLDYLASAGFQTFQSIGCANCHQPVLQTRGHQLPLASPEVATDPTANVYRYIDLVRVGFDKVPHQDGVYVPFFADLKRHDMGPRLAESFDASRRGVGNTMFTTARLWGIADTAPYLHDGRATTLFEAIEFHGGEAQSARDAFMALSPAQQNNLLRFLGKLRTPDNPDQELVQ